MNFSFRAAVLLPTFFGICGFWGASQATAQDYPPSPLPDTSLPAARRPSRVAPIEKTAAPDVAPPATKLTADEVRYENGVVIAQAGQNPVRVEGAGIRLTARQVWIDIANKKLRAAGEVVVERDIVAERKRLQDRLLPESKQTEKFTETLRGSDFQYDFNAKQGQLDKVSIRLASFNIEAQSLTVNGEIYTARNIVLRFGASSEEDRRIYGTPPYSIHASQITLDAQARDGRGSIAATGGGLYFKNTKILPVPSYVFRTATPFGRREDKAFKLTPRISTNSADRFLITTGLEFPFKRNDPDRYSLTTDIGFSARVAFRGGIGLNARTRFGDITLRGRINDIVTTQLTNRIELNREPELVYASPIVPIFGLPGGRSAGLYLQAGTGRFRESQTGIAGSDVLSTRHQAQVGITTRVVDKDGPYFNLFARTASYPTLDAHYRNVGFEAGYIGSLSKYLRGQFSYTDINLSGATPFRFDRVEIARELRSTFDINLTPRYIIPIDLRYDLDLNELRDERVGLLRSYKTFAYGVTYQTARRELQLDFRQGF